MTRRPGGSRRRRLSLFGVVLLLLPVAFVGGCGGGQEPAELTVAAASDLAGATEALGVAFRDTAGITVVFDLGSSGQLAQQIEAGAPVDVFMAANTDYVRELVDKGLVASDDMAPYARGRLVIWTRDDASARIDDLAELADPRVARIAIANPEHAPYGSAARQALEATGLWAAVRPKLVMGENVLQALQFAESGNADAALVAASVVVGAGGRTAPVAEGLHDPLMQTLGTLKTSKHLEAARAFAKFMRGPDAQAILARYGFEAPGS